MEQDTFYMVCWGLLLFFVFGLMLSLIFMNSTSYYEKQEYNTLKPLEQNVPSEAKPEAIQHYEEMRDESVRATEESNQEVNETGGLTGVGIENINYSIQNALESGKLTRVMLVVIVTHFIVTHFVIMIVGIFSDNTSLGGRPRNMVLSIMVAMMLVIMIPEMSTTVIAGIAIMIGIFDPLRVSRIITPF